MLRVRTRNPALLGEKMPDHIQLSNNLRFGLVLISLSLAGCGGSTADPEDAVRTWVSSAEVAAEEKDRRGIVEMISENYADVRGNERKDIDNLLRLYFLRQKAITILTKVDAVTMFGTTAAKVSLTTGMAGTNDGILGLSADAYRFELELENDGDDWLLIGARWGGLGKELK